MILGTKDVTEMLKNASELEISKAISKGIKLVPVRKARRTTKEFHRTQRRFIHNHPGGSTKAAARMRWIGQPRKNMAGFTLTHRKGDFISVPASLRSLFYIQH